MPIQEFQLYGGGPSALYPLMEKFLDSTNQAAERIGGNIRASMMQNEANSQAKGMANDAQALLQNPQATTDPNALLSGLYQLTAKYPLGAQTQAGQTITQTIGGQAQARAQAMATVNPYYSASGSSGGGGGASGSSPQPTGVAAFDKSDGGVGAGVTPSGMAAPSGMIPTAPTGGPMAQPTVQVNGTQMPPNVVPGQAAGGPVAPAQAPVDQVGQAASEAVSSARSQLNQTQGMLARLVQNPHAKAADVERMQTQVSQANKDLVSALDQQSKIAAGVGKQADIKQRFTERMTNQRDEFRQKREDTTKYRDQVQSRFQAALDLKTKTGDAAQLDKVTQQEGNAMKLKVQGIQKDIANYQSEIKQRQNNIIAIQSAAFATGKNPSAESQDLIDSLNSQIDEYKDQIDGANEDVQNLQNSFDDALAQAKAKVGSKSSDGKGKPLDAATAQQLLQQAGGDKDKARDLAKQAGYAF